jgi:hypothetical protein
MRKHAHYIVPGYERDLSGQRFRVWITCWGAGQDVQGKRLFKAENTLERRPEVKSWLEQSAQRIILSMREGSRHAHDAALRQAAEMRLLEQGPLAEGSSIRKSVIAFSMQMVSNEGWCYYGSRE